MKKAFPTGTVKRSETGSMVSIPESDNGMDLRDYFAAKVIQGMVTQKDWFSNGCYWKSVEEMTSAYADEAYKFADAMMKERDRKQPEACSVEEAFGL